MKIHYVELKDFLSILETQPETIMDQNYDVFKSEKKLYGNEKKRRIIAAMINQSVYTRICLLSIHGIKSHNCQWSCTM